MINTKELAVQATEALLYAQAGYDYTVVVQMKTIATRGEPGRSTTITTEIHDEEMTRLIFDIFVICHEVIGNPGTVNQEFMTIAFPNTHGMIRLVGEEPKNYVNLLRLNIETTLVDGNE